MHSSKDDVSVPNDGSEFPRDETAPQDGLSYNPALAIKTKIILDIEPFPGNIVNKISVPNTFRPAEKDGELIVPIVVKYQCVFDDAPTCVEERSEVWAGSGYGTTTWLTSKRLGTFPTRVDESILRSLQGLEGTESNAEVMERLTNKRCSVEKSTTIGRYIASMLTAGDNHITLLTAAYCVLFDRLWWYVPSSRFTYYQRSCQRKERINTFDLRRTPTCYCRYGLGIDVARIRQANCRCEE
jgi:hypothetical protein